MIGIYCGDLHGSRGAPCPECAELLDYARARLEYCVFRDSKPTCGKCPIHCYRPGMRERIRSVMRHAGPRMALRHPWLALRHALDGLKRPPPRPGNNAAPR